MKLLLHCLLSVVQPGSHLGESTAIKHFLSLLTFFSISSLLLPFLFCFFSFSFFLPLLPLPFTFSPLSFSSFFCFRSKTLKSSYGFRGSDVSSISGVWGITTDEIEFDAFVLKIGHLDDLVALFWADRSRHLC